MKVPTWNLTFNLTKKIVSFQQLTKEAHALCDVIFQTVSKIGGIKAKFLQSGPRPTLQPLRQNLCLASDSKKVLAKPCLSGLGITNMVSDS